MNPIVFIAGLAAALAHRPAGPTVLRLHPAPSVNLTSPPFFGPWRGITAADWGMSANCQRLRGKNKLRAAGVAGQRR